MGRPDQIFKRLFGALFQRIYLYRTGMDTDQGVTLHTHQPGPDRTVLPRNCALADPYKCLTGAIPAWLGNNHDTSLSFLLKQKRIKTGLPVKRQRNGQTGLLQTV